MTINIIQTPVSGYDAKRLEQIEPQRQDAQKTKAPQDTGTDRISISDEGRIKASMLKAAQDSDGIRADKVAEVKARISSGTYAPNSQDIAAGMLRQELDIWG